MIAHSRDSVELGPLLQSLHPAGRVCGPTDRAVSALAVDSRHAAPGCVFVALRGEQTDGHRYVDEAIRRGSIAVVLEEPRELPTGVTAIVVADSARALSQLANAFYGAPSHRIAVAGVTGTNGKTTTVHMVAAMLQAGGIACGTIGTVGAYVHDRQWPLERTTPPAPELQSLLERMRELGAQAVAMEVSSHAIVQQRVGDVRFKVAGLTNVTRDHLDYHKTFEAYAGAKHRLFEMAEQCVLNADDAAGAAWAHELREHKPVTTYGLRNAADLRAENVVLTAREGRFSVDSQAFVVRFPGRFNVENALCALGIARLVGVSDSHAATGLESLERVAGRMERITGGGIDVVVDYAHTPDALENVLRTLRATTTGRLVAVFGCGGDRDRGKRPEMGAAVARHADFAIVTSDNPRTENPLEIIAQTLEGMGNAPHAVEPDRRAAIEAAVSDAAPGDLILIAGKGHEAYQIVGETVHPFDDVAIARSALSRRSAAP